MTIAENCYGFWTDGILFLPSPSILTIASNHIPSTALHEFVHHVTYAVNPDPEYEHTINRAIPKYIVEGIAEYETNGQAQSYDFMIAAKAIRNGTFPSFDEIEAMYKSALNPEVYTWGALFCEYVSKQYGSETMAQIPRNPDIEVVLGKSKDNIRLEWIEFLKKEYKINV